MELKEMYDHLRTTDEKRYNEFRAKLVLANCLNRFERTICKPGFDLRRVDFWIAECMIEFLGFTPDNFRTNSFPVSGQLLGIPN
ncbi:hypothetical protein ACFPMF_27600 [Larkinella bovis]|uniref:Uncharacterized protein n=1 Tax=Larkinella bovis TaxID=683041 RepID=A0ABW0ILC3_9BACT